MHSVIDLIKHDNLFSLKKLINNDKFILKYKYGIFPIISVAVLYDSKKIIKYLNNYYYI